MNSQNTFNFIIYPWVIFRFTITINLYVLLLYYGRLLPLNVMWFSFNKSKSSAKNILFTVFYSIFNQSLIKMFTFKKPIFATKSYNNIYIHTIFFNLSKEISYSHIFYARIFSDISQKLHKIKKFYMTNFEKKATGD